MRATHTGAGDRQAQGQDGQTSRPGAGGAPSSHCCRKECGWLAKGTRDGNRRTPMRGMGEVGAEVRRRRKAADGEGERAPLPREVHSPQASRAVGHKSSEGASNQAKQSRRGVGNKDGSGREGGGGRAGRHGGWSRSIDQGAVPLNPISTSIVQSHRRQHKPVPTAVATAGNACRYRRGPYPTVTSNLQSRCANREECGRAERQRGDTITGIKEGLATVPRTPLTRVLRRQQED